MRCCYSGRSVVSVSAAAFSSHVSLCLIYRFIVNGDRTYCDCIFVRINVTKYNVLYGELSFLINGVAYENCLLNVRQTLLSSYELFVAIR